MKLPKLGSLVELQGDGRLYMQLDRIREVVAILHGSRNGLTIAEVCDKLAERYGVFNPRTIRRDLHFLEAILMAEAYAGTRERKRKDQPVILFRLIEAGLTRPGNQLFTQRIAYRSDGRRYAVESDK